LNQKIWIDLDNSPHVLFFKPIIDELDKRGFEVTLTARDAYQVCELADKYGLHYKKIGHHYGKNKIMKILGTFIRSGQMARFVLREKPHIALSHGSRSQLILASVLGVLSIMLSDYEHAKTIRLFPPTWIMVPEMIPDHSINFSKSKIYKYPGIKEDVYIPSFRPDSGIMDELGIDDRNIIVLFRPPATEAHYHNPESEILFKIAIEYLAKFPDTRIVLLPRNHRQKLDVQNRWPNLISERKLIIPDHVVNGPNLIWHSDFVISGGGTMNREAAALRVPVYSIFRGKIGAVDQYLVRIDRLTLLQKEDDIYSKLNVEKRIKCDLNECNKGMVFNAVVDKIIQIANN
jgi:predicted glycosyltransferase